MIPQPITKEFSLPDGRKVTIETGKLAKQADGAVVVSMGDAKLLATVVSDKDAKEGTDFLPLTVDYQEKFASAGKIPGGFLKREGRLSDYEVLICRLIDRALRPMFPGDYHANTQIMVSLISADKDVLPDALAGFAASAALMVSDIPFQGPTAHVRVGRVDGNFIISPTPDQLEKSDIDMVVAGSEENLVMVEGEMDEVGEQDMIDALMQAHEAIKLMCKAQKELESAVGKTQKREYNHEVNDLELKEKLHKEYYDKYFEVAKKANPDKKQRSEDFSAIVDSYMETLPEDTDDLTKGMIKGYFHDIQKEACRNLVLELNNRLDGRQLDEIRPIWTEVSYLPSAHGSAVFTRGETQSLTTVTLGTKYDEQMIDSAMFSGSNKFILHYNFPAFSTGEARPNRGPGRREVGHGNLAMRALKKVVPADEDNPYTIRVVSDILESNGSSSMATVCAGSMALMDAGIKIAAPVSGIAMGLISDPKTGKYAVLSDILGDEDHLGDMDFKVTGTEKGITACQMDMKVEGLSKEILTKALEQSTRGRMHILGEMKKTIATPREDLKPSAPRFAKVNIDKDMVGTLIGPGGKVIQEMQRETDTTIVVEEIPGQDKALVSIFAQNQESMELAVQRVKGVAGSATVGEVYEGEVKGIVPFGAFIEYMPGRQGLLHISEIKWERVENVEDVFKIGDKVEVKLLDIDSKTGKAKLSRKVLLPKPEGQTSA